MMQLGVELPSYGEVSHSGLRSIARSIGKHRDDDPWRMVLDPKPFDVVVMRLHTSGFPGHVGLMVSENHLIHAEEATGCCVVKMDHPVVRERILGLRRHKCR